MTPSRVTGLSLPRIRQLALIGTGWTIIAFSVLLTPLPGPGGLPLALVGGVILLRNSASARRLFVRLKKRYPRMLSPAERGLQFLRRRQKAKRRAAADAAG
ncbi:hypothetical protein [Azospirillum sp. SYSU D00513]|uniref:hypothetical protein n=1 Tax=Azospirillum sp. SYSU D00513 TaxID=2812561 RepID=UPI001A96D64F|nr:hypothetical protein [Azospirillum sp. SYSU D00513]